MKRLENNTASSNRHTGSSPFVDEMEVSGYVDENQTNNIAVESIITTSGTSNVIHTECGKALDLSKISRILIPVQNASRYVKAINMGKESDPKTRNMDKKKTSGNLIITIDSSSDNEDIRQSPSSQKDILRRTSRKALSHSRSNSNSPRKPDYKRSQILSSSDEEVEVLRIKKKRRLIFSDDEEDEPQLLDSDNSNVSNDGKKRKRRSRKIKSKEELATETLDAEEAEIQRRDRLAVKQKEFNGIEYETVSANDGTSLLQKLKQVVLDPDSNNRKPIPVKVHPLLCRVLKSHQAEGIQFMYENTFENLERFRRGDPGGGGILAHCMGLGKTLQVVAFIHTILNHKEISIKISKVLIVVPKNVVLNWRNEFNKWLEPHRLDTFPIYELDSFKKDGDRLSCLRNWKSEDGPSVMIIGYDMFRLLTQSPEDRRFLLKKSKKPPPKPKKLTSKQKKFVKNQEEYRELLQNPGPDIVICDEGHKLKNDETVLTQTMLKIKTKRRICLTGTPLQNNLKEYYVMISFVKPGLLGNKVEFANQFENPIEHGRTKDASPFDVRLMKRRCFVLFDRLKHVVQRKDISVLKQEIPGKMEYVLNVRLTEPQVQLYQLFLSMIDKAGGANLRQRLFSDYYIFSRIWTHPYQIIHHENEKHLKELKNYDSFIEDDDEISLASEGYSDENSDYEVPTVNRATRRSNRLAGDVSPLRPRSPSPTPGISGWWSQYVTQEDQFNVEMSNKLLILFDIIKRCEAIGDKLLVFSQSLESLRLISSFLEEYDKTGKWFVDGHECLAAKGEKWGWKKGSDYLVIDGKVNAHDRENIQSRFNNKKNLRSRLILISTRAGSLGTNMVAANRVVIFDSCWNPSHDTQSLFRVYRIGQTKPVFIYRLVAYGTMEHCIYKRQVTKDSTSMRVIDEAQIQRHFLNRDLDVLYTLEHKPYDENESYSMVPPKDRLLGELILKNPAAIVDYIVHENLFENLEDEKLTLEERKEAWEEYTNSKKTGKPQNDILKGSTNFHNNMPATFMNANTSSNSINDVGVDFSLSRNILNDAIYTSALGAGLDLKQATSVTCIKLMLHSLLDQLPPHARDGISEFGTMINEILGNEETASTKTAIILDLFHTLSDVFRKFYATRGLLEHYYKSSPWLAPDSRPVSSTLNK